MAEKLDLSTIFNAVTSQLSQKKDALNEADTYNHDHGDHMVQIFDLIQGAVAKKSDEPLEAQLDYARKVVEEKAQSGSGKLYAEGLSRAAESLSGSNLNVDGIGTLVKSLLGAESASQQAEQKQQSSGVFGSLLSNLTGGSKTSDEDQGLGVDELLRAGLSFYQSKQEGDSNTEALMDALLAASPMGQSAHRKQSGSIVASTIMNFAQSLKK